MDAIRTYLDNVFAAFPQTERVQMMKCEMLNSMEEKYLALKQEGKSEHEAVGSVIANFGSIDEIAAELGLERGREEPEQGLALSREEVETYLAQTRRASIWFGLATWLILTGVAALIFLADVAGLVTMLAAIAVAVIVFVIHGIRMERYEAYQKERIRLDSQTQREIQAQSERFMPRFTIAIVAGIALIFLGVIGFLGLFQDFQLGLAFMLFSIGFAVFVFIIGGMPKTAYDVLLNQGEHSDKTKSNKIGRIIGAIASAYWPLIVAIYLLWSFLGDAWMISWVVWPVAGVIFGAIAGSVSVWISTKDK